MRTASKSRRVASAAAVIGLGLVTATTVVGSQAAAQPPPVEPESACSPGFWKNHADSWTPTGLDPTQPTGELFDQAVLHGLDEEELLQSLGGGGGADLDGAATILLRAAVAALLNASIPDGEFAMSGDDVTLAVNDALASADREQMLTLAEELDELNNDGTCADDVAGTDAAADVAPADVPVGPPADVPVGRPADVPAGPPADVPVGPPADVPVGPPADVPVGPPADVPVGPPADVPVGPPADVPAGPPADVPVGPPADVPVGPPAG